MQINQTNLASLFKGYKALFLGALNAAVTQWQSVAMSTSSNALQEVYGWLGAFPKMREFLGEVVIQNLAANTYSISNKEFESTIAVKELHVETDQFGLYNPLFESAGFSANAHKDELVAALLTNGFTSKDYTDKNFFDTDKKHSPGDKKSTTFSNKGTKKLSGANFETALAALKSMKDGAGNPLGLGRKIVLVVHPNNEALAKRILKADLVSGGDTNVNKDSAELMVWSSLTNADAWFLLEVGFPIKPLILQRVKETTLTGCTNPEDHHVMTKHEFLYQAYGIYGAGYGLPQLAWGSTGADAA